MSVPDRVSLPDYSHGETEKRLLDTFSVPDNVELNIALVLPDYAENLGLQLLPGSEPDIWKFGIQGLPEPVAKLIAKDGKLAFAWGSTSPPSARAALHNSVLEISVGPKTYNMHLREVEVGEAFPFTLNAARTNKARGIRITNTTATQSRTFEPAPIGEFEELWFQVVPLNPAAFDNECPFPEDPVPVSRPVRWECGNDGLLNAKFRWECDLVGGEVVISQHGQYKLRRSWRPFTSREIQQHIKDLNKRLLGKQKDVGRKTNAVNLAQNNLANIPNNLPPNKRQALEHNLRKVLQDAKRALTKAQKRLIEVQEEINTIPALNKFWKVLRNQPLSYRIYSKAGDYEVIVIQSDNDD